MDWIIVLAIVIFLLWLIGGPVLNLGTLVNLLLLLLVIVVIVWIVRAIAGRRTP